jgi:N-methylhydantoinase A
MHRVVGTKTVEPIAFPPHDLAGNDASVAIKGTRNAHFDPDGFVDVPVYDGDLLAAGHTIVGPAIVERPGDSVVIPRPFRATVDEHLALRIAAGAASTEDAAGARSEVAV